MNEANNLHETIHLSIKHFFFWLFLSGWIGKVKIQEYKILQAFTSRWAWCAYYTLNATLLNGVNHLFEFREWEDREGEKWEEGKCWGREKKGIIKRNNSRTKEHRVSAFWAWMERQKFLACPSNTTSWNIIHLNTVDIIDITITIV